MIRVLLTAALLIAPLSMANATTLADVQRDWIDAKYNTSAKAEQESKLNTLVTESGELAKQDAESSIWHAVVLATRAKLIGGTSALDDIRAAKNALEASLSSAAPSAKNGYADALLGALYGKAPGWPISFGNHGTAQKHFAAAAEKGPRNIDVLYLHAEYLAEQEKKADARALLEQAKAIPPRAGQEAADAGRQQEIDALLGRL